MGQRPVAGLALRGGLQMVVGTSLNAPCQRALLLASLTLLVASPAAAQTHLGFTFGPAVSRMSGDVVDSSDLQWGIFVGLNVEYELSPNWQLDLELALSQKGGDKVGIEGGSYDYRLDYVEFPLTLSRLFWINDGPWAIAPFAGFSVGLKMKCEFRPGGERDVEFEECTSETPGGDSSDTFYGIPIGVALRRRFPGGSAMAIEARYTASLTEGSEVGELMARSNSFSVMFSWVWSLDTRSYGTPSEPNPNR